MTARHTPGPWDGTKSGRDDGEWSIVKHTWGGGSWGNDRYQIIATVRACDEVRPNAYLMAAAPELLDALERLVHLAECNTAPGPNTLAQARAAIAKAKGA